MTAETDAMRLVQTITPANIAQMRRVGGLYQWCDNLRAALTDALAAGPAVQPAAGREESKTYYGKDCPIGMVQVEFVGCPPSERYSDYGWKPTKSAFIELYVDGQHYRIDAGDIGQNCFDGKPRRGVHINYPIGAALGDRSINALNLANPGSEPFLSPADAHPPAQGSESGGERLAKLLEEANDFTERMISQPWACELIERLVAALPQPGPASEGDGE